MADWLKSLPYIFTGMTSILKKIKDFPNKHLNTAFSIEEEHKRAHWSSVQLNPILTLFRQVGSITHIIDKIINGVSVSGLVVTQYNQVLTINVNGY